MVAVGIILLVVGLVIDIVGAILLLIRAFQASIWWGLGSIFIPFVSLIFVITHWAVAKRPFLLVILGTVLVIIGSVLAGSSLPHVQPTG